MEAGSIVVVDAMQSEEAGKSVRAIKLMLYMLSGWTQISEKLLIS